jgi:hypothetical protein
MKTIHNVDQGTDEWLELRKGLITSTVIKSLITPTFKISENDKTRKAIYKLAAERITEHLEDGFLSYDMERGNFEEPLARDLYSEDVKQVGFITNVFNGVKVGFSPDGLVEEDGIIEVKSAKQSIQVERIATNQVPVEHLPQIHFGMLVSDADWCDFISYSNGMPMQVIRVYKDEKIQTVLIEAIVLAEKKILETIELYKNNSKNFLKAPRVEVITNEINF